MAHNKSPPPPTPANCEFCGLDSTVLFRGKVGGFKARICGTCVLDYAKIIAARAAEFEASQPPVSEQGPLAAE